MKNRLLEGGKIPENPPKKTLSVQRREPKTKPTHIWRRRRDLKPGPHSWEASALTNALTTATPLLPELMYALMKRLLNQNGVGYISLTLVCMMEYTLWFSFLLRNCFLQPGLLYHAGSASCLVFLENCRCVYMRRPAAPLGEIFLQIVFFWVSCMFLAPSFNLKFFGKFQTERSVIKKFLIKRVYFVVLGRIISQMVIPVVSIHV